MRGFFDAKLFNDLALGSHLCLGAAKAIGDFSFILLLVSFIFIFIF
uniref:Uncharacterized protein n=1 Tax=Rhizophora mucronata TaxID=61149 RepID=A0A2P2PUM9_RHIMU